jgi:hypothetical protein
MKFDSSLIGQAQLKGGTMTALIKSMQIYIRLIFTIICESFKHINQTTKITIEDIGNGKQDLRIEYKSH